MGATNDADLFGRASSNGTFSPSLTQTTKVLFQFLSYGLVKIAPEARVPSAGVRPSSLLRRLLRA